MERILHIVGAMTRAGAETMIMNLYRSVDKKLYQFDFYCTTGKSGEYDEEIRDLGGRVFYAPKKNGIGKIVSFHRFIKMHPEYNIVHSHVLLGSGFYLALAKLGGVRRTICHSHSTSYRGMSNVFLRRLYYKFATSLIRKFSTAYIACGQKAGEFLYPSIADFYILPNAIDLKFFTRLGQENKDYLSNMFSLDKNTFKIVQVGRLVDIKNHEFTLKIAEELSKRNFDFCLFIIGQGPLHGKLKHIIEEKGLGKYVKLMGVRSDVPYLMAGADLNLLPSLHEGFPVVLVESQAIGLYSIVSNNVSEEVDLGLGKIIFKDIQSISTWVEHIFTRLKEVDSSEKIDIYNAMSNKGFDINKSIAMLQSIYIV